MWCDMFMEGETQHIVDFVKAMREDGFWDENDEWADDNEPVGGE